VAGLFLGDGVAYVEQGRDGERTEVSIPQHDVLVPELPLIVLVDYGTASSAEILAGALRDNDRATVLGEQTFGTGTVLNTFDLSDGSALRIGVLKWLTPDGTDVFRVGLAPDEVVGLAPGDLAVDPGQLLGMTLRELEASGDRQLLQALESLQA
jgi:carboxyl-terminal processing protease